MIKLKKSLLALRTNHLLTDSVLRYKKLEDTINIIRTMLVSALLRQFGHCFGLFDIAG
jgi:hypothetical protein